MPITIKSTGMKYKNPDTGVYQGVDMLEEATIRDVIVDVYSPTLPYAVGKYCLYNGELYCCTTAIPSGGETWNLAHWDKTNVTDELEDIKGAVDSIGSDDVANESNVTGATVSDALDNLNGALKDVLNDTKTSITTDPASLDAIKSYDVGIYRVAISNTTVFPTGYGILEILKGQDYGMARFSNVNSANPAVWRVQWNTSSGSWYQGGVWLDEQKYVKENKISNSGDTYTGALTYHTEQYTSGTAPSATKYAPFFQLSDAADANIVIFQGTSYTNGDEGFEIVSRRLKNGSWAYNTLRLTLDSSGDPKVFVADQAAWRKGLGLCYAANDTFSTSLGVIISGYISAGATQFYGDFTTEKSLENISTVTVTACTGFMRGSNGYVNNATSNTNYTTGNYTATAQKITNNRVRITIGVLPSAVAFTNVTNNTPVIYSGSLGLKFT